MLCPGCVIFTAGGVQFQNRGASGSELVHDQGITLCCDGDGPARCFALLTLVVELPDSGKNFPAEVIFILLYLGFDYFFSGFCLLYPAAGLPPVEDGNTETETKDFLVQRFQVCINERGAGL